MFMPIATMTMFTFTQGMKLLGEIMLRQVITGGEEFTAITLIT